MSVSYSLVSLLSIRCYEIFIIVNHFTLGRLIFKFNHLNWKAQQQLAATAALLCIDLRVISLSGWNREQ